MDCNGCVRENTATVLEALLAVTLNPIFIELALVCSSLHFTLLAIGICFVLMLSFLNAYFEFSHLNMIVK